MHLSALIRSAFWISTHAPLAGRDVDAGGVEGRTINISTHAPLAGRDRYQQQDQRARQYFNPRAPCGARPFAPSGINSGIRFQPTRPLRGATAWEAVDMASDGISTHAPLAGRDEMVQDTPVEGVISTHAPLAGRDGAADRSARGERISTHAPLAGRDRPAKLHQSRRGISTHAPLAGRDDPAALRNFAHAVFQPTRPLRGATVNTGNFVTDCAFQPTRPLRGATETSCQDGYTTKNFNPRAPCGARLSPH